MAHASFDPDPNKSISELRQWYDDDFIEKIKLHRAWKKHMLGSASERYYAERGAENRLYENELNKRRRSLTRNQRKAA